MKKLKKLKKPRNLTGALLPICQPGVSSGPKEHPAASIEAV
jgi:hypothetical protein